jgi:molybdopterin converting factor small subunit
VATITVQFYTLWKQCLGVDKVEIQADNIEDALSQIDKKYGTVLREKLQDRGTRVDGKIQDFSLVLLNNINLRNFKGSSLREGDVLRFFPPVLGG